MKTRLIFSGTWTSLAYDLQVEHHSGLKARDFSKCLFTNPIHPGYSFYSGKGSAITCKKSKPASIPAAEDLVIPFFSQISNLFTKV
jgi:hypothetical protein